LLIYEYNSVSAVLKKFLSDRKDRNPRYSMRAFARDLKMSPSALSEIISEVHDLSPARASEIASFLSLSAHQADYFKALADLGAAKSSAEISVARANLDRFSMQSPEVQISKEQLDIYGSWETLALLEALKLRDSARTIEWLSEATGIESTRVSELCQVLCKHEFASQDSDGRFTALRERSSTVAPGGKRPESTIRNFHGRILAKASEAIDEQSLSERDFSAMIFATSSKQTPEVIEAIKTFRRTVMAAGEGFDESQKDSVYCLSVQWFKLTK
jgi:uncharacterized protein (TIGR02147 family)